MSTRIDRKTIFRNGYARTISISNLDENNNTSLMRQSDHSFETTR